MTSGLFQVCNLWLWVSMCMPHVKHLAAKILMAVNYCERKLAWRLGWAAPAYHMKKGATPLSGVCKHILQYDWRPDGHFRG